MEYKQPQTEVRRPVINRSIDELNEVAGNLVKVTEELTVRLSSVCRQDPPSPAVAGQIGKCDPSTPSMASALQDIITRLHTALSLAESIVGRLEI